jgi:hypothetical protein
MHGISWAPLGTQYRRPCNSSSAREAVSDFTVLYQRAATATNVCQGIQADWRSSDTHLTIAIDLYDLHEMRTRCLSFVKELMTALRSSGVSVFRYVLYEACLTQSQCRLLRFRQAIDWHHPAVLAAWSAASPTQVTQHRFGTMHSKLFRRRNTLGKTESLLVVAHTLMLLFELTDRRFC